MMKDLLEDLMDSATIGADYADARVVHSRSEQISTRQGEVETLDNDEAVGLGVRVLVGGAWGFAATATVDRASAEGALRRALDLARAQPRVRSAPLVAASAERGRWESASRIDPFSVSIDAKISVLAAADEAMRGDPRVAVTRAHYVALTETRTFASTDGSLVEQRVTECGGGIEAVAIGGEETQIRSYPASFRGDVAQAGYEHFAALGLVAQAPRVAEEAIMLLTAPRCPSGRATLILGGQQLALQLHESVGHAVELDRVLGREASYAGTSFLTAADAGSFRYGSELMNVTADATLPGGLGSFAWDDEGVPARHTEIVRDGVLRGFLSSRESAAEVGEAHSGACMRADGFARQPIVRMTNVSLEPGSAGSLEDLIAATERGLYLESNRSWSIDSRRLHFQFGTEVAWEIVDGRITRLLRNPTYAGTTPEFWASLDAVCSPPAWRLWGVINCGKGEPGQVMRVSHGTAPARFRDVEVGIA
ncbi:MAG: TldD/PmbA family protein [Thermoleophilaceae bacterium]